MTHSIQYLLLSPSIPVAIKFVQRLERQFPLEEYIPLNPPGQPRTDLVGDMARSADSEDVVEFLECAFPGEVRAHPGIPDEHSKAMQRLGLGLGLLTWSQGR